MAKAESLAELRKQWRDDPEFNAEYAALEGEFALIESVMHSEIDSKATQERSTEGSKRGNYGPPKGN